MADYETKDITGSLFANDRKVKPSQPDRKGKCKVGNHEYWVGAWEKTSKNGETYLSLGFTPIEEQF